MLVSNKYLEIKDKKILRVKVNHFW